MSDDPLDTTPRPCAYCGENFTPTPGWSQGQYCSKAHRFAAGEMKHVAYEEKFCEFKDELHGDAHAVEAIRYADERVSEIRPVVQGLTHAQQEAFCDWFSTFASLSPFRLWVVFQRLEGKTGVEIAAVTNTTTQNVNKAATKAMRQVPQLKVLLNGRTTIADVRALLDEDPTQSAQDIARRLGLNPNTTANWIRKIKHKRTLEAEAQAEADIADTSEQSQVVDSEGVMGPPGAPTHGVGSVRPLFLAENEVSENGGVVSVSRNTVPKDEGELAHA